MAGFLPRALVVLWVIYCVYGSTTRPGQTTTTRPVSSSRASGIGSTASSAAPSITRSFMADKTTPVSRAPGSPRPTRPPRTTDPIAPPRPSHPTGVTRPPRTIDPTGSPRPTHPGPRPTRPPDVPASPRPTRPSGGTRPTRPPSTPEPTKEPTTPEVTRPSPTPPAVDALELRLSGGDGSHGVLLVLRPGDNWALVCEDGWTVTEATVACAQLGFLWGKPVTNTYLTRIPRTMLSGVRCRGGEDDLAQCDHGPWMEKHCDQDVALECRNTSVAFTNGSSEHYGQVHLASGGRLVPVCNSGWNDPDAKVVCREMGYGGGAAFQNLILYNGRIFPPTYETINYVSCRGDESSLAACSFRVLNYGCSGNGAGTYAMAVCYNGTEDVDTLNRVQTEIVGPSPNWGRVEVLYKGVRATVCNKYVDDEEATLVCRQHGYKGGNITGHGNLAVEEQTPILLTSPSCVGNETSLNQCNSFNSSTLPFRVTCSHVSDFYVLCHNQSIQWRLNGLNSTSLGRLELNYEGTWGSVCAAGIEEEQADAACASLGFYGGWLYNTYEGMAPATGPVWIDNIHCYGMESDLLECATDGWDELTTNPDCAEHNNDLVLSCYNKVRIVDGGSPNFGRVEVRTASRDWWGTVCGQGWDDVDAGVVCRELGWQKGKALCCSVLGTQRGWYGASLTSVSCQGHEASLLDCEAPSSYCRSSSVNYGSVYCYNGELDQAETYAYMDPATVPAPYQGAVGLVRMIYSGLDGRVCGDGWDARDANVTCRELGFRGGVDFNVSVSGSGPFVMDPARCEGNESRLADCDHEAWGSDGCRRDAGVLCHNGTGTRLLVEGGGTTGNLIIEHDGIQGHICDADWTETDANRACRQMGYLGGDVGHRTFSSTNLPVFLRNVRCGARDVSFFQCANDGWALDIADGCMGRESVASVVCYGYVRLDLIASTLHAEVGRVKVFSNGRWSAVCGTGFTETHAQIVCKELGYNNSKAPHPYHFPASHTSYMIVGVTCTGNEDSLADCQYTPASYYYYSGCYHSNRNNAIVLCSNEAIDESRTINWDTGRTPSISGKVAVTQYSLQGKVCADAWSDNAANVVCRNHGYNGGVAITYQEHTASVDWILTLNCTGDEMSLSECTMNEDINLPCSSTREIGVLCYNAGVQYRLMNGDRSLEGRVEIQHDGMWGGVCDSGWDDDDANVICRQLGYYGGDAISDSVFGGIGVHWMKRVDCSGNEDTLLQCPSSGWHSVSDTDYTCGPANTAGVRCYENVRTSTGMSAGPVQAHMDGYWGSICDDDWDDNDAQVACRQMGYPYGIGACCSVFGDSSFLTFILGGFQCDGTETDLFDCPHREGSYLSCPGRNYASVICYSEEPSANISEARVIEGSNGDSLSFTTGVVQVMFAGVWGYICPEGWTDKEASVLCRQLGYSDHGIGYPNSLSAHGVTPYWLCNVTCTGSENHLGECRNPGWGQIDGCTTRNRAAVVCYNRAYSTRLVNGGANYGRLEITIDGMTGTVCDQGWGSRDPEVACREMGFQSGSASTGSAYGRGAGMFWLSSVACSGRETSILQCAHPGLGLSTSTYWTWRCSSHGYDAGAHCFGSVRLVDGPNRGFGRVEAYNSSTSEWNVFCDDGLFDDGDAVVLCQNLGFRGGRAICCSAVAYENSRSTLYEKTIMNVSCEEGGSSLSNCSYTVGECASMQYVSLYCTQTPNSQAPSTMRVSINESTIPDIISNNGRLIVNIDGIEGRVCAKNFDDKAANVACHMLGYSGGAAFQFSVRRRTPYVMHHVKCNGTESTLADCDYSKYDTDSECTYGESEAGVLCFNNTGFQYRLSEGKHGVVELALDGQWGLVCTTGWSGNDARVLCRQLGYVDGSTTSESVPDSYTYSRRVWMSSIYCDGTESSLLRCKNNGWGNVPYYCSRSSRFAGATCFDRVRLTTRSQGVPVSAGSVEVYVNDEWGLVCDDGFDNADARVVCRQLGFQDGIQSCCSAFGFRYMQTMWTRVGCTGTEDDLHHCSHDAMPFNADCDYASVACLDYERNDTAAVDYSLRLSVQGGLSYSGKVLVEVFGVTGRICSDGWNDAAANVACVQLGYPHGEAYRHYDAQSNYLDDIGPWWTSQVMCPQGNESRLDECNLTPWGSVTQCESGHSAGVLCYSDSGTFFRLAGGGDNYGRVEVSVNGEWGTVCDTNWAWPEASVFCRQMGYADGEPVSRSSRLFDSGSGPVWLSRFQCVGNENNLMECGHSGFNTETSSSCRYHLRDAGVYCFKAVRLDNGVPNEHNDLSAGGLLYVHNHTWSAVCADNFTDLTAGQVCRELGHYDGRAILGSAYRYLARELLNGTLDCNGTEQDIRECYQDLDNCSSGQYASVFCLPHNHTYNDSVYTFSLDVGSSPTPQPRQLRTDHYKHGSVLVHYLGQDGRLCSESWEDADATVLCRSLGYGHGVAYNQSLHNLASTLGGVQSVTEADSLPFLLGQMNCIGTESDLMECDHQDRLELSKCSWDAMAGAICFSNYSEIGYRLADGPTENQGRVEMSIAGVWGTICDASWGDADASVFCRSLNYSDGEASHGAHYGEGTGVVWVSHVHCNGSEGALHQCNHQGFNTSFSESAILTWDNNQDSFITPSWPVFKYCYDHTNDASAFCFDEVRLSNGANATSGAVQISSNGNWTLVCDEGWGEVEAKVVCKQLGYADGLAIPHSSFGIIDNSEITQKIKCTGDEKSLTACSSSTEVCATGTYASVYCSEKPKNETTGPIVRIQNDSLSSSHHGVLQLQYEGFWGRVCINNWGDAEAMVACKMLNYTGGVAYRHVHSLSSGQLPVMLSNVSCVGNESSLMDCQYTMWGDPYVCKTAPYEAGVICYSGSGIEYRLQGGTSNSGRVEIAYDGQWGTVCDLYWNMPDAHVFCRSLNRGFLDGQAISADSVPESWGRGSGRIWLQAAMCIGTESSILTCPHSGWNVSWAQYHFYSCDSHTRDAGVQCYSDYMRIEGIRLVGGPDNSTGRVEVYMTQAEEWGTVCDDFFDDNEAMVICRMLGYRRGSAIASSSQYRAAGTGPIWLDNLGCLGNETHLQNCSHQGIGNHNCHHFEDAGVQCFEPLVVVTTPAVASTSPSTTSSTSPVTTTSTLPPSTTSRSPTSSISTSPMPPPSPTPTTSPTSPRTTPSTSSPPFVSSTTAQTGTPVNPTPTRTTTSSSPNTTPSRVTTTTHITPTPAPSITSSTTTGTTTAHITQTRPPTTTTTGTTTIHTTPSRGPRPSTGRTRPTTAIYTTPTPATTPATATKLVPTAPTTMNNSLPGSHSVAGGMSTTLTAVVSVLVVVAIIAIVLIVVFFLYHQRSKRKRRCHAGPISLSDIDNSVPYEAAGMDPSGDQQFSNKLYDLALGKSPDLYKSMDASDAGHDHMNGDISTDQATIIHHEFLPAMEEISFSNVPNNNNNSIA